jgi:lysophospholipase L1-like esterase
MRRSIGRGSWALVVTTSAVSLLLLTGAPTFGPPPSSTSVSGPALSAASGRSLSVVALGDSVPGGDACSCAPYPVLYGRLLARRTGDRVTVHNVGTNGLDTAGLLTQLDDPAVSVPVSGADVVLVTIGANDFGDDHDEVTEGTCVTSDGDCADDQLMSMRAGLSQVLARVSALRNGAPTTVLVTGYWNVFEDGDVATSAYGVTGVQASIDLTRRVNASIEMSSRAAGATYVDLFTPFQSRGTRITSLLADDGDHPDAAGHALIARVLLAVGLPVLGKVPG